MGLSSELLSQFAKATKDKSIKKSETIVYGTIVDSNGVKYVQLDGSDILTPMASTTNIESGERVPVMIKNHMAIVTGNLTSPAVRTADLDIAYSEINTDLTIMAGLVESKVSQDDFNALNEKVQSNSSEIQQTPTNIKMEVQNQVGEAIDDLSIGGRNRLRYTKPMEISKFGVDSSGASAMGSYEAYGDGLHVINRQSNLRVWLTEPVGKLNVSPGQSITVSFKYSMLSGNSPLQIQAGWYRDASDTAPGYADSDPNEAAESHRFPQTAQMVDGGWGWVQATFIVPDGYYLATFAFRSGQDFRLYDCEYLVREFKVENGTKATDWTPAPEDVDDKIAKSQTATLEITNNSITQNVTTINNRIDGVVSNTNAALAGKASNEDLNKVVQRVDSAEQKITSDAIVNTVRSSTLYANDLASKADDGDIVNVNNRIDGVVNDTNAALAGKASNEDLGNVIARVSTAEQQITSDAIVNTVRSSTLYASDLNGKANTGDITNVNNRIDGVVNNTNAALAGKVDTTYLVENYSTVSQTNDRIKMEVASKTVGATNLAALGKVGFGNSEGGTSTGALEDHPEAHYCRSKKVMRLFAFSGNHNVGEYDLIPLASGKTYTVSFWAASDADNQSLVVNIWNYSRGVDIQIGDTIQTSTSGGYYTRTFICTVTDTYALRFINFGGHTANIGIMDVKLEEGNTATAWSPHPEEFRSGSNIEITENTVKVISETTFIGVPSSDGETMVAQFDENGLTADKVLGNNLAYRYCGPTTLYVNPSASSDQIAGGGVYRSLGDLFGQLSSRMLDGDITIHIQGDSYGNVALYRTVGGSITIHGNNCSVNGSLSFCDVGTRVYVNSLNIINNGNDYAAYVAGGDFVRWYGCTINGNNQATYSLMLYEGANSMIWDCGLYNATSLIYAGHTCDVSFVSNRGGGCTYFITVDGCTAKFSGTRPDGAIEYHNTSLLAPSDPSTLTVDTGSSQSIAPGSGTATYDFLYSDSFHGGWSYFSDDDVRQGYITKQIYGTMWFDASAIRSALSGKTINQASLRLYMHSGVGRGVAVSVQLYGTNTAYSGRSAAPALTTSYGTIGSTNPGELNEITIPTQVITDIVNGTIQGLVLLSDDTEQYNGRGYSRNYARFDGSTSGDSSTRPRLTVIYS